jgi:hypothetical protein
MGLGWGLYFPLEENDAWFCLGEHGWRANTILRWNAARCFLKPQRLRSGLLERPKQQIKRHRLRW